LPGALRRELPLGTGCAESYQPCAERIALSAEARIPVVLPERRTPKLARRAASPQTPSSARSRCLRAAASAAPLPSATEPARPHASLLVSCAPTPRGRRTLWLACGNEVWNVAANEMVWNKKKENGQCSYPIYWWGTVLQYFFSSGYW
jgi:hypothetical protein